MATPLREICDEMKVDAETARRKLRAAGMKKHKTLGWTFDDQQIKRVKEVLGSEKVTD
jgi:hypothetical protein